MHNVTHILHMQTVCKQQAVTLHTSKIICAQNPETLLYLFIQYSSLASCNHNLLLVNKCLLSMRWRCNKPHECFMTALLYSETFRWCQSVHQTKWCQSVHQTKFLHSVALMFKANLPQGNKPIRIYTVLFELPEPTRTTQTHLNAEARYS